MGAHCWANMLHIKVSHAFSTASPAVATIEVCVHSSKRCQVLYVCLPSYGISFHLRMRVCPCMTHPDAVCAAGSGQGAVCSDPSPVVNAPRQEPAMQYLGSATPHPTTGAHPPFYSHHLTSVSWHVSDDSLQSCSQQLCTCCVLENLCAARAAPHSLHHTMQKLSVNGFCHHTLFRHGLALAQSAYTCTYWMSAC